MGMTQPPSQADREANPHYTIMVNVKLTKGTALARSAQDVLAVNTTDKDKNAAIRRAIALLQIELEDTVVSAHWGLTQENAAKPKPPVSPWMDSEKR